MGPEQRDDIVQSDFTGQSQGGRNPNCQTKLFPITKRQVYEAYKRVKANRGASGVDHQSLKDFDENLSSNLYKLWNRMASGSYHAPPVRAVDIDKKDGGQRRLGVPTISDRIAQMVAKMYFEPDVEFYLYPDSYGYRPKKSAIEAVGVVRRRCWRYDWVLDLNGLRAVHRQPNDTELTALRPFTTGSGCEISTGY